MHGTSRLSSYTPDRSPTWTEIFFSLCVVLALAVNAPRWDPFPPAVVAGFVLAGLVLGPVAASAPGQKAGRLSQHVGVAGRVLVAPLLIVAADVAIQLDWLPAEPAIDAVSGGLLAFVLSVSLHAMLAGSVSGWGLHRGEQN